MDGVVPLEEGVSRGSGCGSMCEAGMRLLEVSSSPCEGHLSKAWLSRMLLLLLRPNSATKKPFVWFWAGLALRQWSAGRVRRTGGTCGTDNTQIPLVCTYIFGRPSTSTPTGYSCTQTMGHQLYVCVCVCVMISQPTCSLHLYPVNGFGRDEGEGGGGRKEKVGDRVGRIESLHHGSTEQKKLAVPGSAGTTQMYTFQDSTRQLRHPQWRL